MKRFGIWDFIFWLALLILILWVIFKILGIINTPAIIEVLPYLSGVFIAGAVWQQFKSMQHDLFHIRRALKRFEKVEYEHGLMMSGKLEH